MQCNFIAAIVTVPTIDEIVKEEGAHSPITKSLLENSPEATSSVHNYLIHIGRHAGNNKALYHHQTIITFRASNDGSGVAETSKLDNYYATKLIMKEQNFVSVRVAVTVLHTVASY